MALCCKAGQRRHRFALAACGEKQQLGRRDAIDLLEGYGQPVGNLEETELARSLEVGLKAPPYDGDAPAELACRSHQVLDAVDVGREVGHDDASGGVGEDPLEGRVQVALRARASRPLGVGRVAEQEQHSFIAEPAKASHVRGVSVGWVRIQLEVARIDDLSDWGVDGQSHGVGYGMTHGDRFHTKRPQLYRVANAHLTEVGLAQETVLLQLRFDEPEGQPCAVDRNVELLQRVRQTPDVVFMAVRREDAEHVAIRLKEVRDVRQHEVDAGHVLLGKHEAGVDDQDLLLPFERPHVDADLAKAAQGDVTASRRRHRGPHALTPKAPTSWGFSQEAQLLRFLLCWCDRRGWRRRIQERLEVRLDPIEVVLEVSHQSAVVQRGGRVVERHVSDVTSLEEAPVDARDRALTGHQALKRVATEDENDLRPHELQLAFEIWRARLGFVGHRVAVHGRAALENVGDVHVRPAQPDPRKKSVEQLAGRAHERLALAVFVEARSLTDDQDVGRTRTDPRHRLGASGMQSAVRARADRGVELSQLLDGVKRLLLPP